jgi:hypothetical protein
MGTLLTLLGVIVLVLLGALMPLYWISRRGRGKSSEKDSE